MKAVVLSGEGSKGAFQAYVMHHLVGRVNPNFIIGVSSGALNAAGFSLLGPDGLKRFWREIKSISDIFSFNWRFLWQTGVFHSGPLKEKLSHLSGSFSVPILFPITCAETGDTTWISLNRFSAFDQKAILNLLSAVTIPGLVREDYGSIDGGVSVLCPLKKAIDLGATELHVILGRSPLDIPTFTPWKFLPFASYAYRFLDLVMHNLMLSDIYRVADINKKVKMGTSDKNYIPIHIYYPERPLPDALAFQHSKAMVSGQWTGYAKLSL